MDTIDNNEITYLSLLDLLINYPIHKEKIIMSYYKLIKQLSDTVVYDLNKFMLNLNQINNYGIIYIAFLNIPSSDEFIIVASGTCFLEPKIIHNFMNVGHIEDIVVDANFRGKSIVHNILNHLKNYAVSNNCYKVILDCHQDLVKIYSKSSYIQKGVQMAIYFL
jgi:glucosamine-phosphate N-acetyltransferase